MDKPLKILILEDSHDDVELIARELKRGGIVFTSSVVDEKHDFVRALHEMNPDVILSDHSLPQFNSIEALKIYQQYQRETNNMVPFILITGSVSEEFAVQCIKAGADDYILKDRLKRLPASILSALQKTRIERERLKFFDEIISNEAMMREAEQLAHFGSWQIDLVTGKHKWSDEGYRMLGYEPGGLHLTYETFLDHVHPEDREFLKNAIDETVLRLDSYACEFRIMDRAGNIKHLLTNILVKRNPERQALRLSGFNLDITEQKRQTQALAHQNKQLIEIAWMQSHEVRGPLARLMGLIDLLEGGQCDEKVLQELLKHLLASAHELDAVIKKIVRKTESIEGPNNPV
jgi:CheY-like chemotaxis protein